MASSLLLVLVIGLTMITASVLNSGYLVAKAVAKDEGSTSDSGSSSGDSNNKDSGTSDKGSDSGSSDTGSGNDSPPSTTTDKPVQEAKPTKQETLKENPITTTTPNPNPTTDLPKCDGSKQDCITRNGDTCKAGEGGEKCECAPDNSDCSKNPNVIATDPPVKNPILPACLIPEGCPSPNIPDKSCAFNPDSPKCAPDSQGNCPPGFGHNVHGNCFPSGPCPKGFGKHTDDETGKCFRNEPSHSHSHVKVIVKEVHHTTTKVVHKNQISGIATVFVPKVGLVEPFNCKLNTDNGKIGCEFLIVKVIK